MNPLTLVKRIQSINSKEAALGISEEASWHAKYKDSAYVFVGGIPFDLTEGDLLAVFAQYGEIVDVNLVRDKGTGKSKGFAFIAYEDQRSTNLAVDNLNGAQILGRIIRVDHVGNYKKKEEEDEETRQQKREARGVCRAFQRGECTRGAGCKFSHDEQRAANTGWGHEDRSSKWGHDKFDGPKRSENRSVNDGPFDTEMKYSDRMNEKRSIRHNDSETDQKSREDHRKEEKRLRSHDVDEFVPRSRAEDYKREEKRLRRHDIDEFEARSRGEDDRREEKRSRRHDGDEVDVRLRVDDDRREKKKSRRHYSDSYRKEDRDNSRGDKCSTHGRDSSSHHHREKDSYRHKSDR